MVALLYWIAKLELETIKVEIADFPFFSHQLIVYNQRNEYKEPWRYRECEVGVDCLTRWHFLNKEESSAIVFIGVFQCRDTVK